MNRRELVIRVGALLLVLPAAKVLSACGGDDGGNGGGGNGGGGGTDAGTSGSLNFTSSSDQGHTHTVSLTLASITDSPATGVDRDTSIDAGHLHSVSLSEADLDSINAGNTVSKTTTNVSGHTHTFDFRKT